MAVSLPCRYPTENPEVLSGVFGDIFRVVTAPFKAVGHTAGEIYRGVSRGDFERVMLAPVKGGTHFVMETFRGTADAAAVAVPILVIAGTIPSPASPFLLAGAGGLGALHAIRQKQLAGDALNSQEVEFINQQMAAGNVQMVDVDTYNQIKGTVADAEAQFAAANPSQKKLSMPVLAAGGAVAAAFAFLMFS